MSPQPPDGCGGRRTRGFRSLLRGNQLRSCPPSLRHGAALHQPREHPKQPRDFSAGTVARACPLGDGRLGMWCCPEVLCGPPAEEGLAIPRGQTPADTDRGHGPEGGRGAATRREGPPGGVMTVPHYRSRPVTGPPDVEPVLWQRHTPTHERNSPRTQNGTKSETEMGIPKTRN